MDKIWIDIVLIAAGILANAFFAGSEIALVSARAGRLVELQQRAVAGAAIALRLKESPEAFLATIQIAITAVGTLTSVVGGAAAVEALTPWLARLGLGAWSQPIALAAVVVVITFVSLVLGELTPKALALRNPERLASAVAPVVLALSRLSSWLVRILTGSANLVLRMLGVGPSREIAFVSEAEVRYLLREGAAQGVFDKVEEELVRNVFAFADATVREIMVRRPDIKAIDVATPSAELLATAAEIGHSRIPVYRESLENIVGVLVLKDLVRTVALGEEPRLDAFLHPPVFVPDTSRVSIVLREFQRTRQNLAMVVDEYGGVVGLITVEDIVEEIVGEIREERETAPSPITRLPNGSALVDGRASMTEVREQLGIPVEDSPDYATVGGFVITTLDAIPSPGVTFMRAGHRWTVVEMSGPRVARVKVEAIARGLR
jgi:putative hemolysin